MQKQRMNLRKKKLGIGGGGVGKGEGCRNPVGLFWEAGSPPRPQPVVSPGPGLGVRAQPVSPRQRAAASSRTRAAGRSSQTGRLQVGERCGRGLPLRCFHPPPQQAVGEPGAPAVQPERIASVPAQEAKPIRVFIDRALLFFLLNTNY